MGRHHKDYSHLIGEKFGDREILGIIRKNTRGYSEIYAVCKCKCGRVHEVYLSKLLRNYHAHACLYCVKADKIEPNVQNKVGIRNISFSDSRQRYEVDIMRNGTRKRGVATTLSKAKALKEQFLQEFENEAKAHD